MASLNVLFQYFDNILFKVWKNVYFLGKNCKITKISLKNWIVKNLKGEILKTKTNKEASVSIDKRQY